MVKQNTTIQNPYGLGNYQINIKSTEILRKHLLGKNLQSSYLADGNPLPPPYGVQKPGDFSYQNLSDNFVIDQKTVMEIGEKYQTSLFLDNSYGPEGGYTDVKMIDVEKVLPRLGKDYVSPNTIQPKNFVSATYTPGEILDTVNITNGVTNTLNSKILNDSRLMSVSSGYLRRGLAAKQQQFLFETTDGPGTPPPAEKNISTSPSQLILEGTDFMSRITDLYYGYSEIPGNYFDSVFVPDINGLKLNQISYQGGLDNFQATAEAIINGIIGNDGIPNSPGALPIPSDTFINYMVVEQQSALFKALNYNIYRPDYSRTQTPSSVEKATPFYYVGSRENEPGKIQSPMGAVPQDEFGRNTGALVYGPSTVAKELETVNGTPLWQFYQFGLQGNTVGDGGGLVGGWTWFGNQSFASTNAPPGMLFTRSFTKPKRKGGILDETQKLIDSAPLMGGARRRHAGHAIDQTSKVFNDGYFKIPKGSGAMVVDGGEDSVNGDYCRTWTKDNPYYKMVNLQRYRGNQLGDKNSVLSNTYDLNIAPTVNANGEPVNFGTKDGENITKYMFSIENLAWRGSEELQSLPQAEKGPNGGRIMWFPPYDISIGDTNSAQWNSVNFLGRPEPVYTYNYTERIGTLSFKIVVDHPSILNVIAQKELNNKIDYNADRILESFFAGCKKYDIYELAATYSKLSLNDIIETQNAIQANDITDEYNENPQGAINNNGTTGTDSPIPPGSGDAPGTGSAGSGDAPIQSASAQILEEMASGNTNTTTTEDDELPNLFGAGAPGQTIPPDSVAAQNNQGEASENVSGLNTRKILARLLGEQNYFKHLENEDEFVFSSIKRQLKYFHPSFHSMTPEGLNSRLTFLLQCTRPGKTIPTETREGQVEVDADNTAFGAPPICILRVGDLYNTKIAIDSVSFSYDPLVFDMNPEGIGLQPMIANVQMNFKYIGGQSLEKPVSELQNALSFNFFANTEMYDDRSTSYKKAKPLPKEQELITAITDAANQTTEQNQSDSSEEDNNLDGETNLNELEEYPNLFDE